MRIKKDKDSWRSRGIIKRDFKHDKSQPIRNLLRLAKKKDTKKWCKGKVGVEHDYETVFPKNEPVLIRGFRKIPVCKVCGRHDYRNTIYLNRKTGLFEKDAPWKQD